MSEKLTVNGLDDYYRIFPSRSKMNETFSPEKEAPQYSR
jgi:hypothetical protein